MSLFPINFLSAFDSEKKKKKKSNYNDVTMTFNI